MQQALGLQALNWLCQLELRLKASGSEAVSPGKKAAAQVIDWCIEQQLKGLRQQQMQGMVLEPVLLT